MGIFRRRQWFFFQFANLNQVQECKAYFSEKTHASTREEGHDLEHYWHPWFSKLPPGIKKSSKKQKVIKVLDQILEEWKNS